MRERDASSRAASRRRRRQHDVTGAVGRYAMDLSYGSHRLCNLRRRASASASACVATVRLVSFVIRVRHRNDCDQNHNATRRDASVTAFTPKTG